MQFTSTRNSSLSVKFSEAVRDCFPADGGVFIPSEIEDMRRWIYYMDESTSFSSVAGSITSALIKDEFSPIICEKIATAAFPFSPTVRQIDDHLFMMELYNGYTGCHKDFGISYLASYLEYTLQLNGGKAIFLDFTSGSLGALFSNILKGKKNLKAVLVYQKGTVRGLKDEDLVWNGGNIYPIEMEGTEAEIKNTIAQIFGDANFVKQYNLTVANTTNVCRLLGQIFIFPYSFAQIKKKIDGDVYYALDAGNYGTLIAGLYSWKFALPVSGFLVPATNELSQSPDGIPVVTDSFIDLSKRKNTSPVSPANLERLESFFGNNAMMIRNFIFPSEVSEKQREKAAKELYIKYGIFADPETARAYACIKDRGNEIFDEAGSVVLTAYNHPALSADYCRHIIGESPKIPQNIQESLKGYELNRPYATTSDDLKKIIQDL